MQAEFRGTHMNRLKDISQQRKRAHAKHLASGSKVYQAFIDMEQAAYSDGALPKTIKELIAVGIAVATHCESDSITQG